MHAAGAPRATAAERIAQAADSIAHALRARLRVGWLRGDIVWRERLLQHVGNVLGVTVLQIMNMPATDRLLPSAIDQCIDPACLVDVAWLRRNHQHRVDARHRYDTHHARQRSAALPAKRILQRTGEVLHIAGVDRQKRVRLPCEDIGIEGLYQTLQALSCLRFAADQQRVVPWVGDYLATVADVWLQHLGEVLGRSIVQWHNDGARCSVGSQGSGCLRGWHERYKLPDCTKAAPFWANSDCSTDSNCVRANGLTVRNVAAPCTAGSIV